MSAERRPGNNNSHRKDVEKTVIPMRRNGQRSVSIQGVVRDSNGPVDVEGMLNLIRQAEIARDEKRNAKKK
ncbi:hypothetical protein A3H87_01065 [Candidatus Curtissbacteria bacterium RIFCSPLOWO2_02_FULL_42_37]|nr:MAG: hypothetical protein A3G16_03155 [Candidatus Curtissbacteria bacterium RIFCSPLOWO2_12_FULL_41_16]OGE11898.1 MAG: hypothetical protein A3H87_01065 [Candidatus Curtissbacteria bacterium RIFCSPLOWO2_02_FULL_42_37]